MNRIWLTAPEPAFRRHLESALVRAGMAPDCLLGSILSVDEMLSNIVEHGYRKGSGSIQVCVWSQAQGIIRVALLDRAPDTSWFRKPFPSLEDQAKKLASRGRGRAIVQGLARRVVHRSRPGGGNILLLELSTHTHMPHRGESVLCPQPTLNI